MKELHLGTVEARFAEIIWQNAPLSSAELAMRAEEVIGWKKTTSYTVLKRLCDKGLFQNEKGTVSVLMTREDFEARKSEQFVEESFQGSLPAFLAAFTSRRGLSKEEVAQLRRMVEQYEEG